MSLSAFGLAENATPEELKEIWRKKASELHPDHGGDAAEFSRWRKLYKDALEEAEAPKFCKQCHGKKKVNVVNGWNTVSMPCPSCNGTGYENSGEDNNGDES